MQGFNYLLAFTLVIAICGCGGKKKKTSSTYSYFQWGEYLHYYEKFDSAFLMFNRAATSSTDSVEKARAYNYLGAMQRRAGDLYGSQESLTAALKSLDDDNQQHRDIIATIDNSLGNTSLDLKRYDEAIAFYNAGLAMATKKDTLLELMNGKATAHQKKGDYGKAILIYDSILVMEPTEKMLRARVISNLARTKWLREGDVPLNQYWLAMKLRTERQDNRGLNASYAHLSDYYAEKKHDSALYYAQRMYEKAIEIQSPDDRLEAIDKLIRLSNSPDRKEEWYNEFKRLNDSLQLARDTTRSRYALIRYDVQKSKADNLALQQHLTRQRLLIYGVSGLAAAIIAGLSVWYQRRRKRIRQESERAIQESRLKTSQKVHDVVANGLYGIMNELEYREVVDKESLITRVEGLYERSRNISYEVMSAQGGMDYDTQIHGLLNDFSNNQTEVVIVGNQGNFWKRVTADKKKELLLVLSEIMVNMRKHSGAGSVVVRFEHTANQGYVFYNDDGCGFPAGLKFGNGLRNTVNRISALGGEVIFGESEKGGASITINFPLALGNYDR